MKRNLSIRFLIGLSQREDSRIVPGMTHPEYESMIEARRLGALNYLSSWYTFGGSYKGVGYWEGKSEPCMSWETILPDSDEVRAQARDVARQLARILRQDCIGLVFAPVEFETVNGD